MSAAVVIRRLAFRFRRQLRPVYVVAAMPLVGAVAHEARNGLRIALACTVVGIVAVVVLASRRMDRTPEQAYAVGAVAAAGVWLSTVAAQGLSGLLLAILGVGGIALAGPWWWHVRVRRGARPAPVANDAAEVWEEHVANPGQALPGSQLIGVRLLENKGWTATIVLPRGVASTDTAIAATKDVTSAFELPIGAVAIERTADGIASHARITVVPDNPLMSGVTFQKPSLDRKTGLAEVGVHMDNTPARYAMWAPMSGAVHTLVAGTTGSGKSRFLEQLLAEARHSGLVVSWLIDPQGGQSLPRWIDRCDWSARSSEDGLALIEAAHRVMHARSKHLAQREWTDAKGRRIKGVDHFTPTPEMPLLLLVVEEASDLLRAYPNAVELLALIGKMGRKCGVGLVLALQKPSVDELGGSSTLRAMASSGNIVCFRTSDRVSAGMAFAGSLPGDPSAIPKTFPDGSSTGGMAYISGPGSRAAIMRAFYVEDPYEWAHSGSPAQLDAISARAAGGEYQLRAQDGGDGEESVSVTSEGLDSDETVVTGPWAGSTDQLDGEVESEPVEASSTAARDTSPDTPRLAPVPTVEDLDVDELGDDVDEHEGLPAGLTATAVVERLLKAEGGQQVQTYSIIRAALEMDREEYRYKPSHIAETLRELEDEGRVRHERQGYWSLTEVSS